MGDNCCGCPASEGCGEKDDKKTEEGKCSECGSDPCQCGEDKDK